VIDRSSIATEGYTSINIHSADPRHLYQNLSEPRRIESRRVKSDYRVDRAISRKPPKYHQRAMCTEARRSKDAVKVLENGSSVADHAESHVRWILPWLDRDKFFRTDVRFRRPFLAGEPRGTMNYCCSRETPCISDDRPPTAWKKIKKGHTPFFPREFVDVPAFRWQRVLLMSLGTYRADR